MELNKKNNYNFGFIKIKPTFNNIFITLTDINGNVLLTKHAGLLNFKGSKKKTPFVASQVITNLIVEIKNMNFNFKVLIVQLYGYIRSCVINSVFRQLHILNLKNIIYLQYVNKKIHNGLRLKKKRRL